MYLANVPNLRWELCSSSVSLKWDQNILKTLACLIASLELFFFACMCVFGVMAACWMSQTICQMWQGHARIYLWLEHKLEIEEKGGLVIKKHKLQDSCCLTAFPLSLPLHLTMTLSISLSFSLSLHPSGEIWACWVLQWEFGVQSVLV